MSIINLPEAKNRNLFLAKQVDQVSINEITRAIVEINDSDEKLKKNLRSLRFELRASTHKTLRRFLRRGCLSMHGSSRDHEDF